jgi:uncharacterized surface protein with fasciclin (FAS1) repeats
MAVPVKYHRFNYYKETDMRKSTLFLLATGSMICTAMPALARNAIVENALKSRSELSSFYEAMVNTGVINELNEGVSYTVFAPTNEALAAITPAQYPCFYSADCRAEVATVLRNHIATGEEHVSDVSQHKGAVISINRYHIAIGEPSKNNFSADGKKIISQNQLMGSILYRIDGVLASDQQLAEFRTLKTVPVAATATEKTTTSTYYTPAGQPAGEAATTTVTHTYTTESPAR